MTEFTHIRENNDDTERHLSENREKFETDCVFLLKLMLRGERLTRKEVVQKYEINDRRLGNLFESGKCKREWMYKDLPNGKKKRTHVEYFCEIPKLLTKQQLIDNWDKLKQGRLL